MKAIEKIIFNELASRRAIVLPHVGTLRIDRCTAELGDKGVKAPSNRINFSATEDEGRATVVSVMEAMGVDRAQAGHAYSEWLEEVRDGNDLTINGVGELVGGVFTPTVELDQMLNPAKYAEPERRPSASVGGGGMAAATVATTVAAGAAMQQPVEPTASAMSATFVPAPQAETASYTSPQAEAVSPMQPVATQSMAQGQAPAQQYVQQPSAAPVQPVVVQQYGRPEQPPKERNAFCLTNILLMIIIILMLLFALFFFFSGFVRNSNAHRERVERPRTERVLPPDAGAHGKRHLPGTATRETTESVGDASAVGTENTGVESAGQQTVGVTGAAGTAGAAQKASQARQSRAESPAATQYKKYYIISGTFREEGNADDRIRWYGRYFPDVKAEKVPYAGGLTAVVVYGTDDKAEAERVARQMRREQENPHLWIWERR